MLDKKSLTPLYIQARELLEERILTGEYKPNQKIPSERNLCEELGISRMTLRQVIMWLVRDGFLKSVPGKGTFVLEPKSSALINGRKDIRTILEEQMGNTHNKVTEICEMTAPKGVAKVMSLDDEGIVIRIVITGIRNGKPCRTGVTYINRELYRLATIESIKEHIESSAIYKEFYEQAIRQETTIEAASATKEDAEELEIDKGHTLLLCIVKSYDNNDKVFEYSSVMYPGETVRIEFRDNILD